MLRKGHKDVMLREEEHPILRFEHVSFFGKLMKSKELKYCLVTPEVLYGMVVSEINGRCY